MTTPLPNPFQFENSAASRPTQPAAEQATAQVPSDAVAAPFTPTPEFMDRLYATITQSTPPDQVPLFLRKPSPEYLRALFRLVGDDEGASARSYNSDAGGYTRAHQRASYGALDASDSHLDRETGSDRRYD